MDQAYIWAGGVLVGLLFACVELGRRLGIQRVRAGNAESNQGSGAVESVVFALFGLLLAFTFSGAAARFDERKALVVQEANAIGTAYLRLDLLDAQAQQVLRPLFKTYLQSRIASYDALASGDQAFQAWLSASAGIQAKIWQAAVEGVGRAASPAVTPMVLPPINDMIDITTTRFAAMQSHPPQIIYLLLVVFALASALIVGYGMASVRRRNWLHVLLFVSCIASTMYVILDIEHPRHGLIRVDGVDMHLRALLASMQ